MNRPATVKHINETLEKTKQAMFVYIYLEILTITGLASYVYHHFSYTYSIYVFFFERFMQTIDRSYKEKII